jgi:hypothetical protein
MPSKYTKSAKYSDCMVRVPGVCNFDRQTTVAAHLNGAGMGIKQLDIFIAYCCSDCHAWLDGGYINQGVLRAVRDLWHLQAIIRTQQKMVEDKTLNI